MTGEEMERAIQFLIEHHAKVSTDIEKLKETQERTAANLESLAECVSRLKARTETDRSDMREQSKIVTEDMRNRLNILILGNEVTRDLTEQVRLALEGRLPIRSQFRGGAAAMLKSRLNDAQSNSVTRDCY